ncbi:MAG: ATP-binding protein [Alphaproteobacteria bacterium]
MDEASRTVFFAPGTVIFREGDQSDVAYLIVDGRVEITKEVGGDTIVITTLTKGEFLGEMSLIDGGGRSATARVLAPSTLQVVSAETFREQMENTPPLIRRVLDMVTTRLRYQTRDAAKRIQADAESGLLEVIETSPIAVGITDRKGKFLYWNQLCYRLGRHHRDERGSPRFGFVFADPEHYASLLTRLESDSVVFQEEAELVRADDSRVWVQVTMQRMEFEGQDAVLTWLYDITQMKEQEAALDKARIEAENANRAKSDFLATMSHEIRTPMNGVITMAEILDQTELTEGQRAMTTIVRDSSSALLAIIDDVLDFSKIEAGRLQIERVELSVGQIIEGVADLLGPRAAEKGLELVTSIDPEVPDHLIGDPVRVRQVLMNLIGNAIKFTEHGHLLAEVTLVDRRGDAVELLFRVCDTGIGISPETRGLLFKPFIQADSSTVRKFGGTGLGLSICRTVITLMGGAIDVDSIPGQGSTFWFRLWFPQLPERRALPHRDLSGLRALVVSSLAAQAAVLRKYLTFGRASVTAVLSGADALAELRAAAVDRPYHMVLMDTDVGDSSGLDLARTIDADEDLGKPRLVLMLPKMAAFSFMDMNYGFVFAAVSKPMRRRFLCHVVAAAGGLVPLHDESKPSRRRDDNFRMCFIPPPPEQALATGNLILVAEDNPTNQTVIRMLLDRLGYSADIAANGVEAWSMLQKRRYGLLLTDCHMPEMDGYQLARMVRDHEPPGGARLPIIALTAEVLAGTARKCSECGMDAYLKKPVVWEELEANIQRWLPGAAKLRRRSDSAATARVVGLGDTPPPCPQPDPKPDPGPDNGAPAIDPAYLLDLLGGEQAMLRPMLDQYVETTRPLVEELLAALEEKTWDQARKKAHACVGASKTAGAMDFAEMCRVIEHAIVDNDHATALAAATRVAESFERVAAAVLKL